MTRTRTTIRAGDGAALWADQRGQGPDVLFIAGLSDPAEAWAAQLDGLSDRYRVTAFDNRGAGRSPLPPVGCTVADLADDAAAVLRGLDITAAHITGFSGGSAIAQELALRHPELVRSLVLISTWGRADAYFRTMLQAWQSLVDTAPSEQQLLEAFYLWMYTPRAHDDGTVARFIAEALAFPHPQSAEAFQRQVDAFATHDTLDRLGGIGVPTLVVAGDVDIATPSRFGRAVAERIPCAELVVLPGAAHQPFQERPADFNELLDNFWSRVDTARTPELDLAQR